MLVLLVLLVIACLFGLFRFSSIVLVHAHRGGIYVYNTAWFMTFALNQREGVAGSDD